jgi:hypothetical protein
MADNNGRYIRDFFLRSKFHFSPEGHPEIPNAEISEQETIAVSFNGTLRLIGGHAIEIENLTTLPYDVEVSSAFPDPGEGLLFFVSNATQPSWTAIFNSILDSPCGKFCPVLYGGNNARQIRVHTTSVRFKRQIWTDWEEARIHPI